MVARSRRSASRSPSTASPSRFTLRANPSARPGAEVVLQRRGRAASTTRWPTIWRMRRRASGITIRGRSGAEAGARPAAGPGRAATGSAGSGPVATTSARSCRAATRSSSGRITRSTNCMVNADAGRVLDQVVEPVGARRSSPVSASAAAPSHRSTTSTASSASSDGSAMTPWCPRDGPACSVAAARSFWQQPRNTVRWRWGPPSHRRPGPGRRAPATARARAGRR